MAAVVNGDLPLPPSELTALSPGKRKRDATPDKESHEPSNEFRLDDDTSKERFEQSLKDLLQVLSKYDSSLGLLQHPLPARPGSGPDVKRPKLSDATNGAKTIETRILSHEYKYLQEFVEDVETAEKSIFESGDQVAPSTTLVDRTKIFKEQLNNLIRRHPFQVVQPGDSTSDDQEPEPDAIGPPRGDKSVLTVLGNAPRGRQLFSSLEKPGRQVPSTNHSSDAPAATTLHDSSLPAGMAISKVVPYNAVNFEETRSKVRTLGEVFAPRTSLPSLEPPRRTDSSSKRSSVVNWLSPLDATAATASASGDKRYYSSSSVPMAHWLNYGYEPPARPSRRRKPNNDGAVGDRQDKHSQHPSKKQNALFRGLYSSFAPSHDSFGSVVPADTKNRIWWGNSGTRHFRTLLSSESRTELDTTVQVSKMSLDEDALKDTVESFVPEDLNLGDPNEKDQNTEKSDKDMEEILQDISELLRTLDSYRQLRHLGSAVRAQDRERPTDRDGRTMPSDAEFEIYQTLKSSLSTMIATLPPYAVSKLDGEQLAELNISKKILLDGVDYSGTMEEDEYSLHQRQAAKIPQAMGPTRSATTNVSRTSPAASQQRYPARTRHSSSNFQNTQQAYGNRTPSAQYQTNGSPQHPTPLQPSSHRSGYVQQPQFSQPGTPQYTRAGILQQFQKPSQNSNSPSVAQRGHSPAQPPSQPYQHRPAPQNYQPRAPENIYHTPVSGGRSASPQKPSTLGQSPQRQHMSPAPSHNQPRYFQQQSHQQQPSQGQQPAPYPNFPSNQASPVAPAYPNASAAMAYSRSAAEQAALMERNRAQLMESQRQGSRTPQASHHPQTNGQATGRAQSATQESKSNTPSSTT